MSKLNISITSSSISKESPITVDYLINLIKNDESKLGKSSDLVTYLLSNLQKKSSKHKFLIQSTKLRSSVSIDSDLNISSSFGAVWDPDRDGYISLKIGLSDEPNCPIRDQEAEKHYGGENDDGLMIDENIQRKRGHEYKEGNESKEIKEIQEETAKDEDNLNKDYANGNKFYESIELTEDEEPTNVVTEGAKETVLPKVGEKFNKENESKEASSNSDHASEDKVNSNVPINKSVDATLVSIYWIFAN